MDYPFKLVFGAGTRVTRNDKLTDIPSHVFRFKSFKEIEEGEFKTDVLYGIFFVSLLFKFLPFFMDFEIIDFS